MKPAMSVLAILVLSAWPLSNPGGNGKPGAIWSTYIPGVTAYDPLRGLSDVASQFVAEHDIVVTRIEVNVVQGPSAAISPGTFCTTNPALVLSDGTTSTSITLANPTNWFGPSFTDSGPISVSFPAGATVQLKVVQGTPDNFSSAQEDDCPAGDVNVVVQYR